MKPVHILMVISSFRPLIGGGEMQAERLATALVRRGHMVTVLTRHADRRSPEHEVVNGVEVVRVSGQSRWSYSARMLAWIWRHRHRISIIHAQQTNSPLVVGLLGGKLCGIPVVCTPMTFNPELRWLSGHGFNSLRRWLFASIDQWIAKSEEIGQALDAYFPGHVTRIPNGVDTDVYVPARTASDQEMPMVLCVGRLEQPKRVDLLLHAWLQVTTPAKLVIVGSGSRRLEWEQLRDTLKLSHVDFVGNRNDVLQMLQRADVFVLASDLEGMPNALLEAMSCGVPCVASAVGAVPELMADGAGLLVPPGDHASIANALNQLLSTPALYDSLRRESRRRAIERYSLVSVAERVESVYQCVVALEN